MLPRILRLWWLSGALSLENLRAGALGLRSLSDGDWRRDTVARRMLGGRFNGDLYVISYFRMLRVSTCSMVRYRRSIDGAQLNL